MNAGRWYALIAENGWNRTGLGCVFYDADGNLAGFKTRGIEAAIERGELPANEFTRSIDPQPPATHDEMEKTLSGFANAMSVVKWEGGLATLVWDEKAVERTFRFVIGETKEEKN